MRQALILPTLLLAGLALISFFMRPEELAPTPAHIVAAVSPVVQSAQAYLPPVSAPAYAPTRNTEVADPALDANVGFLIDLDSGRVLYEKNSPAHVPIASLTKLLSALIASELFDSQDIVTIASSSVRVDAQKQTLYDGEQMTMGNLIAMMLVESSNDAAYAIAAYAREQDIDFVAAMNQKAIQLGMDQCVFTNPAGLDDTAFCSARSLLKLVRSILRTAPSVWATTALPALSVQSADGRFVHQLKNTNELLGTIEGIVGGKTGYTDGALGCLIVVVKLPEQRGTLVSIVLGSRGRFADTQTLVSWAQNAYRW